MLAALLLAPLLAQAEPAPPEPAPSPAAIAGPLVREANAVSVHAHLAYRLGDNSLGPVGGFSVSGAFERRYLVMARAVELGVAFDFNYQRFSTSVEGSSAATGQEIVFEGQRTLSKTGFALLQTLGVRAGRIRPFIALGPGVAINFFSSPELALRPGTKTVVQPVAQAVAGVDIDLGGNTAFVVRADLTHPFTDPAFEPASGQTPPPRYTLFGDVVALGFGVSVRF